jgi:hypothetical protein
VEINHKGFPRPVLPMKGKNTPIPWVGGTAPEEGAWAAIDSNRAMDAEVDRLCLVCGLELPDDYVFLLAFDQKADMVGISIGGLSLGLPSPTWAHPKCANVAALFCPHLKSEEHPAETQNGQKLTHDDLRELARKSDKPQ